MWQLANPKSICSTTPSGLGFKIVPPTPKFAKSQWNNSMHRFKFAKAVICCDNHGTHRDQIQMIRAHAFSCFESSFDLCNPSGILTVCNTLVLFWNCQQCSFRREVAPQDSQIPYHFVSDGIPGYPPRMLHHKSKLNIDLDISWHFWLFLSILDSYHGYVASIVWLSVLLLLLACNCRPDNWFGFGNLGASLGATLAD